MDFDHGSVLTIMKTFSGFMAHSYENGNTNGKHSRASEGSSDFSKGTLFHDAKYVTQKRYADTIDKVTF